MVTQGIVAELHAEPLRGLHEGDLGPPIPAPRGDGGKPSRKLEEVRDGPLQEVSLQLVTRVINNHDRRVGHKRGVLRVVHGKDSGVPVEGRGGIIALRTTGRSSWSMNAYLQNKNCALLYI